MWKCKKKSDFLKATCLPPPLLPLLPEDLASLQEDGLIVQPGPLAEKHRDLLLNLKRGLDICFLVVSYLYAVIEGHLFALLLLYKVGNFFGKVVAFFINDRCAHQLSDLLEF